jgi:hypothetical protein
MLSFFRKITDVLDEYQIPYMLSDSIALGLYTVPRMTRDIVFIVHLESKNLDLFVNSFKDGFYCDCDASLSAALVSISYLKKGNNLFAFPSPFFNRSIASIIFRKIELYPYFFGRLRLEWVFAFIN